MKLVQTSGYGKGREFSSLENYAEVKLDGSDCERGAVEKEKQEKSKNKTHCRDCGKFTNGNKYCRAHMIDRSFSSLGFGCE